MAQLKDLLVTGKARFLNDLYGNIQGNILNFGTCTTAGGTAAKVATLSNDSTFELKTGSEVYILFSNENIASAAMTLNVNNTGAKTVRLDNNNILNDTGTDTQAYLPRYILANHVYLFKYDGTYWRLINPSHSRSTSVLDTYKILTAAADSLNSSTTLGITHPGAILHYKVTGNAATTSNAKPSFGNGHILHFNWITPGANYANDAANFQLALSTADSRMEIRNNPTNGTAWREVVTANPSTLMGSNTLSIYISTAGRVVVSTYTLNRLYYSAATDSFAETQHFVTPINVFLNDTSSATYPSTSAYTFGVNGATKLYSNNSISPLLYVEDKSGSNVELGGQSNNGSVIIGDIGVSGQHLAIDKNSVMARKTDTSSTATTTAETLYLNQSDGLVQVGVGGILIGVNSTSITSTSDVSGGASNAILGALKVWGGGHFLRHIKLGEWTSTNSAPNGGIRVHDLRHATITNNADKFGDQSVNWYFGKVYGNWAGIMSMKAWTGAYYTWEIAGNSHDSLVDRYYVRSIIGTSTSTTSPGTWHSLVYLPSTALIGSNTLSVYVATTGLVTASTYTLNRLYYSAATNSFEPTEHYADTTHIALNSTALPSTVNILYVKGNTRVDTGGLYVFPNEGSYRNGIRIHASSNSNGWSGIMFASSALTATSGTNATSWWMGNKNGDFYLTKNSDTATTTARLANESNYWTLYPKVGVNGTSTGYNLYVNGTTYLNGASTAADQLYVSTAGDSSSTATGALVVAGGVGVGKQLYVGGVAHFVNTTDATSSTTGAVVISGGASVLKQLRVSGAMTISDTTESTSTTTGALVISGGVGIAKQLYVGGHVYLSSSLQVKNTSTTQTILPETTVTYNLGSTSTYWNGAWIWGNGNIHWNNLINTDSTAVANPITTTLTGRGLIRIFGSNRSSRPSNVLFGVSNKAVTVEFTTDGGNTWADCGITNLDIRNFTNETSMSITPGLNGAGTNFDPYDGTSTASTTGGGSGVTYAANYWTNKGVRVTIDLQKENRCGNVDVLYLRFGTASATNNTSHIIIERQHYNGTWTIIKETAATRWNSSDYNMIIYPNPTFYMAGTSTSTTATYCNKIRVSLIVDSWGTAYRYAPRLLAFAAYGWHGSIGTSTAVAGNEFARFMTTYNVPYLIDDRNTGLLAFDSNLVPRGRTNEYSAVATNDIHSIGTAGRRWGLIYASTGSFNTRLSVGSTATDADYNLHVYGSAFFGSTTRIQYNTPNLFIKDTNTASDTYAIIRFGNKDTDNGAYIFLNGPSRTADGGVNMMTIRNNVGNLRLDNNVYVIGHQYNNSWITKQTGSYDITGLRMVSTGGWTNTSTGEHRYTSLAGDPWAYDIYIAPRIHKTYASTATTASVTATAYEGGYYRWYEWSYSSSNGNRLSNYEYFNLPGVNKDRTSNAGYTIITTKNPGNLYWANVLCTAAASTTTSPTCATYFSKHATAPRFFADIMNATMNTAPSSNLYGCYEIRDKNGRRFGQFEGAILTDKSHIMNMMVANHNSTIGYGGLLIKYDASDNFSATIPTLYAANGLWGGKTRVVDNWVGFYAANNNTTTRYGYIQADANRLRFRKENGTLDGIAFDFSGKVYNNNEFITGGDRGFRIVHNNRGAFWHWNANSGLQWFYLMFTAAGSGLNGSWTSIRAFYANADTGYTYHTRAYSAVWNDYAEFRKGQITEPGRVVIEHKSGIMLLCNERLAAGAKVISDTYGFAIGETKECKTPIAVTGRVLVYPYKDKEKYELGAAVCAAPGGTVDIMTREEIREYPERIIGTVSEIPAYEIWHAGGSVEQGPAEEIKVNGRIWIYVK